MAEGIQIRGRVLGGEELREEFATYGGRLRIELTRALTELGREAQSRVSRLAPRGKTGKLQDTMKMKVTETNKSIRAEVFPGQRYGYILTYGVDRDVKNPRHRKVKVAAPTSVTTSGRIFKLGRATTREIQLERKDAKTGKIRYTKHLKIEPRPFMRLGYEAMQSKIDPAIDDAVSRALEGK